MNSCPLVSVITPMFNGEAFITETIQSVQSQDYENWEMLVIDNCSTDRGRQIVESFAAVDARVKLLSNTHNSGSPGQPRNIGMRNARGKYLAFLDADDLWFMDKLSKQVEYLETCTTVFMLYGRFQVMRLGRLLESVVLPKLGRMHEGSIFRDLFLSDNFIPCLTVMVKNRFAGNYCFDEDPRSMEDYDMWLQISRNERVGYLSQSLGIYRVHGANTTANLRVFVLKYFDLLSVWRKELPAGLMCIKYCLFVIQLVVIIARHVKNRLCASVIGYASKYTGCARFH